MIKLPFFKYSGMVKRNLLPCYGGEQRGDELEGDESESEREEENFSSFSFPHFPSVLF